MESMGTKDPAEERQPKLEDPQEIQIRQRLTNELLTTDWSKLLFQQMRSLQIEFFQSALASQENHQEVRNAYLLLLKTLESLGKTHIISGEEYLTGLNPHNGVIVITNHLGTAKLTSFPPAEVGLDLPIDTIEPFPVRHSPIFNVSNELNRPIYEAAVELPEPINTIQAASGVVLVAAGGMGRLRQLEGNTQKILKKSPNALIVMYPEGGTSGKRNNSGPYDLDTFQTGAFVVSAHLGIPVLPVCQYFNPQSGFEIGILPPIHPQNTNNRDYFQQLAEQTRTDMQNWLDKKHK